ncbi:MAG: DUF1501 domain-containing protein [Saprospiraceae bacterium]|jgi:hypothetical protein|nr:DUF1501 domain-containing protein [Saprospiraceae bacterium]MBK7370117.1 DUF1501 domain-containing protein [Saprospiraceae bacterium]MBK7437821.1 DUF1501 domain-containing protein [Saprospiraceae bacterium]MBK8512130.1 DUF1501 domain-containing protein [Saprospiraceae bacterium]MBK8778560.1 DUF1501 domain-containing protein [Saprospiraceae bacterium]
MKQVDIIEYWRQNQLKLNRRNFLSHSAYGLGAMALQSLLPGISPESQLPVVAKAKRIVYLFMAGGPSQLETFDYKPGLRSMMGQDLPDSVRKGQRLTGMSANQASLPLIPSKFNFNQYGQSQTWVSELMPHTAKIVDELCIIKSMYTEAINHDPAITFFQTGHPLPGRPSIGSWVSYGLGSENENLPGFIVLVSKNGPKDQPLYARLWGNGFLPSQHQGVQFRSGNDPVLFLKNPTGYTTDDRKEMIDQLALLNREQNNYYQDPEVEARIAQYEMAFRMQTSVPEIMDVSKEPEAVFELYGKDSKDPGTYAANCLLARKLLEKDVRFVQLYHQGWDHHGHLPEGMEAQCKATDQATAALITDLKRLGLLEDTLVVWGGEFGRTVYSQGKISNGQYGRDHHPRCFTAWMAGGGVQGGIQYGQTDDFSYNIVKDPVHVHDIQATMLHLLGIDHEKLTFKFQGRRYRLTDVSGKVVQGILA